MTTAAAVDEAWKYPDIPNPDILDRIPLSARIVLDVGCGSGALGAAYKQINPAARVFGIETNQQAARLASSRLETVINSDVETAIFPEELLGRIDCLIYGDVLEHLQDPWTLLKNHVETLLAPGGVVIICMPNVEHWSITARLLTGTFDYSDTGLLDRTHLRFFSQAMMERCIRAAGLQPIDCLPRIFEAEQGRQVINALKPALQTMQVDPDAYARRALPMQYVWRARAGGPGTVQVYSTILAPVGGVSDVRVIEPMRALAAEPGIRAAIVKGGELPPPDPSLPKIWIFHRPALAGEEGLSVLRGILRQGFLIVTEFDDHPDYIPVLQRPDMWNFRGVHAVQTTTMGLADVFRKDNPEVAIFPNGIRALPAPHNHAKRPQMRMLFAGINRENDWPPYIDALNTAARLCGERLHFEVVRDRGFFDALDTPHKSFSDTLEYADYHQKLSDCELSFMPLQDTPFNRAKSDLKFIEAASHRVCALASPVAYENSIQDGKTGILFRTGAELQEKLVALVNNPDAVLQIATAARSYVASERMLAYQMAARTAWYRSLWARKDALNAALLERMPALREG
ncbi:SAM-dependent O-methyltransferase [Granulibacter bethesdensis]|uniref:SAM-dependent O-methyltransferase n=1 Tax=Granulibacter bethesdensis TaxID=364410 RepID=A0AAN0RFP6_9PROT|nr:methyltransferase domain-containing protein [Granulibacter bethesdensis]AHJ64123.1 SAM-dependent O-methyltransferase [Granulibacter bethesdensis]